VSTRLPSLDLRIARFALAQVMRSTVRLLPGWLIAGAAFAGFWALSHGAAFGALPVVGLAESIHLSVAPLGAARIASLSVQLGQRVKAGEVIAQLDGRLLEAKRDGLSAELAKAEAVLSAQRGIQEASVMRGELWALRARASERGDRAALEVLERQMKIYDSLASDHLVTPLQVSATDRERKTLDARVAAYDTARQQGRAGLDWLTAPGGSHASTVAARLEPYKEAVSAAQAELRQAELALEELVLKAPADGCVTAILHRPGEVVPAGTEIVTVISGRPGVVQVSAPEKAAANLHVGSHVRVRRTGFWTRSLDASVLELAPEIDEAPPRARSSPSVPTWGRRMVVQTAATDLLPGELVYVVF
jgi:multidrug resistance efflux pump